MWLLWVAIGIVFGLGAAFFYYKKKLAPLYDVAVDGHTGCAAKLARVYEMLDACHNSIWGPVGLNDQIKVDLFNKLWEWAGLPQNGVPEK